MTLKTVTGPTIRAALSDARRLFGADALLLESTPPAGDAPASVTVAFDEAPAKPARAPRRAPAPKAPAASGHWLDLMDDDAPALPAYGYGAAPRARKARPSRPEAPSADAPSADAPPARREEPAARGRRVASAPAVTAASAPAAQPPAPSSPAAPRPDRTGAEVEALRARIAELEAAIRRPAPASPAAGPRVVVLVGPAGTGKTTLALRLAQQPERLGAATAAVLLVRPDARGLDPSPLYWSGGVAAATVSSGADAHRARAEFADADLLIVDTPALPLHPALARPMVAQLGEALAPLAPLEVLFVLDATRAADAFGPATLSALGLRPDALALTRADEAASDAPARWSERLGLPLQALSSGTAAADLDLAPTTPTETHDMTAPLPDTLAAYA